MIDFFASEQRRLVEAAGEVLDEPSAARLVKKLLPRLIDDPIGALKTSLASVPEAGKPEGGDAELGGVSEGEPGEARLQPPARA